MKKKALVIILSTAMFFSLAGCDGNSGNKETKSNRQVSQDAEPSIRNGDTESSDMPEKTVVIRYGTHNLNGLDPNNKDAVTGEYTMEESQRQAALAALAVVKDAYNVEFKFLQYPNDVATDLMTSVLANDPVCDIALLWGGVEPTILSQNVLQDLKGYSDLFSDEESAWMLKDSMFGGNYLLNNEMPMTYFPFIVNLTMLEKVDSLKDENGKTIYPMDLFKDGKWTWNTFQDYLSKVQAYYANVAAPDGAVHDVVQAYETDHRSAALGAVYAAGGAIYADSQVMADSDKTIKGVDFIKQLMDAKLLTDCGTYDGFTPKWCAGGEDFGRGGTVFTDCANWRVGEHASQCAERGESIGIIPWPRPDGLPFDSKDYMQSTNGGNSCAILKGISKEKTELALKAYKLYWQTYYEALGGVDKVSEYRDATVAADLAGFGVDVYNDKYGQDLIDCYTYILHHMKANYAPMMGLSAPWDKILGKSLYGMDGMSSFDVAIKANITELSNKTDDISAILKTEGVHNNQPPKITKKDAALAMGTDAGSVDWTQYFSAKDPVDGAVSITPDHITVSDDLDLSVVGEYNDAVSVKVSDSSGNEAEGKIKVIVYNPGNTTPPTIKAKEKLLEVALNTDVSGINWNDYLESAVDADGLDVSGNGSLSCTHILCGSTIYVIAYIPYWER